MKKVKLLLTMAVIVFATMLCCSMSAFALIDGDWEFQLLDSEVMITGYLGTDTDIVIPDEIYGCPVTEVHCEEYEKTLMDAVSIKYPAGVKVIQPVTVGGYHSETLETVILPEGVEEIDEAAFQNCYALENINFPSTLKKIGGDAFWDCSKLKNVDFPDGLVEIESHAFFNSGLTEVDLSNTQAKLWYDTFSDCKSLKKAKLPGNLTEIPNNFFRGCISLTDVEIPATVTKIGSEAFYECKSLESIILPVSLKEIAYRGVFQGCEKLREIVIPYGTEIIGRETFFNCTELKSIYVPDTAADIDVYGLKGAPNAIVYCTADSPAAEHCKENKISYLTDSSVNSGIHVLYNGERISFHSYSQNPEILEGRTLVPLRSIFEAMGASVEWDGATSTAIAKRGNVEVKITIGENEIYKNGKAVPVDVPAMLLNSRTMVPARVIAEAFGADVDWNGNGRVVLITE